MTAPWPSLSHCLSPEIGFFFLSLSPAFKLQALPGKSKALIAWRSQEQDSWQSDAALIPCQEPWESPSLRETQARGVPVYHPVLSPYATASVPARAAAAAVGSRGWDGAGQNTPVLVPKRLEGSSSLVSFVPPAQALLPGGAELLMQQDMRV